MFNARLRLSDEVRAAREAGRPIVALESTLISHGLPRGRNLEAARMLEATVRAGGAVPATIAVVDGCLAVGLGEVELEVLAKADGVRKCSRRDLPIVVAGGGRGATTVAGTLAIMGLAGLRVLATGGIGGVHRGAETTFDISADLIELARTAAVVVSAGAKAILDLPRTLELLETLGVPVLGWQTDELPEFYTSSGGLPVLARVDAPGDVAGVARAGWELGLTNGVLVAVPPPMETLLAADEADRAVADALRAAERRGLHGPAVTPFLLDAVAAATDGRSVEANLALLENNARVASRVAVALASQEHTEATKPRSGGIRR
jgi:pseudouridylate synthase